MTVSEKVLPWRRHSAKRLASSSSKARRLARRVRASVRVSTRSVCMRSVCSRRSRSVEASFSCMCWLAAASFSTTSRSLPESWPCERNELIVDFADLTVVFADFEGHLRHQFVQPHGKIHGRLTGQLVQPARGIGDRRAAATACHAALAADVRMPQPPRGSRTSRPAANANSRLTMVSTMILATRRKRMTSQRSIGKRTSQGPVQANAATIAEGLANPPPPPGTIVPAVGFGRPVRRRFSRYSVHGRSAGVAEIVAVALTCRVTELSRRAGSVNEKMFCCGRGQISRLHHNPMML